MPIYEVVIMVILTIAASEINKAARAVCSDGKILWLENGGSDKIQEI